MNYQRFKNVIRSVCAKAAEGCVLRFKNEDGKYIAEYGDTRFESNSVAESIMVSVPNHQFRWKVGEQNA